VILDLTPVLYPAHTARALALWRAHLTAPRSRSAQRTTEWAAIPASERSDRNRRAAVVRWSRRPAADPFEES
jgi:hypothetical protein